MGLGTSGPALCVSEMCLSALACRAAPWSSAGSPPDRPVCGERRMGEGRCSADDHPAPGGMALGTVLPSQGATPRFCLPPAPRCIGSSAHNLWGQSDGKKGCL